MASILCLVRNVIVFFYCLNKGYCENNVDRYFDYLSGYADNSTTPLSHLVSHPEGEPMPLSEWSTRDSAVGLSRLKIMRRWERERYKRLGYLCQKLKHCSTFLIYNDVHYHIPSVVIFQKRKGKQTGMTDAPSGDRSRERDYITREREGRRRGSERKNILHRLSVCHISFM